MYRRVSIKVFVVLILCLCAFPPLKAQEPYIIHVRSSFATFLKQALGPMPGISIRSFSGPMLLISGRQAASDRGAHLIVGFEQQKTLTFQGLTFRPLAKGHLALIVRDTDSRSLKEWLQTQGKIIGQDSQTSSTGMAARQWFLQQGYTPQDLEALFTHTPSSLCAAFLLFKSGIADALIGFTSTPIFAMRDPSIPPLKALPLIGGQEVWGIVITQKGSRDSRTKAVMERLYHSDTKALVYEKLLLEPIQP